MCIDYSEISLDKYTLFNNSPVGNCVSLNNELFVGNYTSKDRQLLIREVERYLFFQWL